MPAIQSAIKRKDPPTDPGVMIDVTREQLSLQLGFIDAVDAKLSVFLGIGSALIGLLAAIVTVQAHDPKYWGLRGVVACAVAYVSVVVVAMIGIWARGWNAEIDTRKLYRDQFDLRAEAAEAAGWGLVHTYEAAYRGNVPAYKLKAWMVRLAQILLVIQTVLLALTLWSVRTGA